MEIVSGIKPSQEPPPDLWNLRRVVPSAQTAVAGQVAVTLLSLEDYAEGFGLHLRLLFAPDHPVVARNRETQAGMRLAALARRDDEAARQEAEQWHRAWFAGNRHPRADMQASDDLGTAYSSYLLRGSSSHDRFTTAYYVFAPALSPSARTLRVTTDRVDWTGHDAESGRPFVSETDPGPWIFVVDLTPGVEASPWSWPEITAR